MIYPKNDLRARVKRASAEPAESRKEVNNTHCTSTHTPLLTYTVRGFMMPALKPDALRGNFPTSPSSL